MLEDKNIVVGVTGGIAAYKAVQIVSSLTKLGANVEVIMTESATEFVKPLTFQSISHNPVRQDMFTPPKNWDVEHISLAQKADLMLLAPATANMIGKLANGIADDMLSTTVMATTAPVLIAPAMNNKMYENPIVQDNISYLKKHNYKFIEADAGYLACGTVGKGRLPDPEEIVQQSIVEILSTEELTEKKVLVTAGGTQEDLDPVRYLGNYSTGKMGYNLARVAQVEGADVTLVSAPTNLNKPNGVDLVEIKSAEEMYQQVMELQEEQDIIIMAAAVADYRPVNREVQKIKKSSDELRLELERTTDILSQLGQVRDDEQVLVGFAAETEDLLANAQQKLKEKQADLIVANDVSASDIGFASDDNQVTLISEQGQKKIKKANKLKIAIQIFNEIMQLAADKE
ncbi:bifunctional phosphopantothenoylcysteine decarboxylase/phosphopantothenate--cysteine ligase CoaBC [Halanaerobacter jeridensis]|uniref:Coenzyme A biosynthesis bifunctional protein CoaBC n=1 Tax=Halanaerobacter jeridensis TaxID=706427 RepID=A0A938XN89_9FIRM|nr:bifunctional phosphopantothenoylcysteine decarboxylase/phosphopantothenate--cysteine ligase CoaBC [Halanaerobacter jeridensis]MBM7555478.1 phosphopantothenoylcysteine decarboxylase/phosphopantothenate--cysteine ligase [Halanaerobacter jeridensis]